MSAGSRRSGGDQVVVGRRPALEAVRSGVATELLVARSSRTTEGLAELLEAARAADLAVAEVSAPVLDGLAGGARHQGVAVRVRGMPELTERDLSGGAWTEDALVLVLDGVTDPHNLGACARTAEAAGAAALVVRRRRGAPTTLAAMKASAGALAHLPVARVANIPRAVTILKDAGFWVVGLEGGADRTLLDSAPPGGRLALVLGAEGAGLSRLTAERCDELLAIPMHGRVGSLNVSVATGVALFAYALRRPS